ncbi:DUF1016 family protein [Candidatus Woesearchaeota archaeon]|nr:DUF1016 family protein [Candidatus Woesearchaeota archaeon]
MSLKKEKNNSTPDYTKILDHIIKYIETSRLHAFAQINKILLKTYWEIGKTLSENASYGKSVVKRLSFDLNQKYPKSKGYSVTNLWNMKRFYETYNNLQTLCEYEKLQPLAGELVFNVSWTNHVLIMDKTSSMEEKIYYLKMCIKERWSKRELKRQIDSSLFERYMLVDTPKKVTALIPKHATKDIVKHFKDEYVLEFLNLKKEYSEQELENAILNNLKDFFLEFGKSFTYIGSQYLIEIGGRENRIDLLFYHRVLKCLVAVDLKIGEFKAEFVGQMQKYLAALDEKVRLDDEKESIGLILCKSKNHEEVRFALAKTLSPVKVATYRTKLPDKKLILKRLENIKITDLKQ